MQVQVHANSHKYNIEAHVVNCMRAFRAAVITLNGHTMKAEASDACGDMCIYSPCLCHRFTFMLLPSLA